MAKTVLEYVQACLSVMDSDDVDSIDDTVEATQVANALRETYYELLARQDWPFMEKPINLTAAGDTSSPTLFTIPATVKRIKHLSYNVSELGGFSRRELCRLNPEDFLVRLGNGETADNTQLVDVGQNIKLYVRNDNWPTYWTSFDDRTVYMDSFHSTYEATLTSDKLQGWGIVVPDFTLADDYEPLLPLNMEPLLQAELNKQCFQNFKQTTSVPDEERSRRQLARARREARVTDRPNDRYYRNAFGRR